MIINPTNPLLKQEKLTTLRTAFSESDLPILVDVLDWALIPESFRAEIKQNYELFYPVDK